MYELNLFASLNNYPAFSARKKHPTFRQAYEKVLARDSYTCQFCSFQAQDYQEIINLDHNYKNNKRSNMATACVFCAQCMFLESLGEGGYGGGIIIYLPEMRQNDLNSLCHVLFCAMEHDTGFKETAQSIYQSFRLRSKIVEEKIGDGASNPSAFGQHIIDYVRDNGELPLDMLQQMRLLPIRSRFKVQLAQWAKRALENMQQQQES